MESDNKDLLGQLRLDRSGSQSNEQSSGIRKALIGAAVVIAAVIAFALYKNLRGASTIQVNVSTVINASNAPTTNSLLDATGYVVARRMATVSAKVTGKVAEILIEEGMRVEQDQIIAKLDDMDAKAQHELAASQLASAKIGMNEVRVQVQQAERELQRQQELSTRKLTSRQALDNAQTQVDASRASLASANAGVRVSEKYLQVAQNNLDNTIIRAPFAGVITVKAAQPGEMISPMSAGGSFTRTGIGTIVDMDSLEVEVDVNETYIQRVNPNMPVEAVLNAYPDWKIPASVIAIIPTADRAKATVRVRIALNTNDQRIVPDMGVRVAFLEAAPDPSEIKQVPVGAVIVPANAIIASAQGDAVFVVSQGKAELRSVVLGNASGDRQQVLSGLTAGEKVITSPSDDIEDGVAVTSDKQ